MDGAATRAPLLVMAVGNLLREDDGFGLAVLEHLRQVELPQTVELFDAGTSVVDLMQVFARRELLLVLDAVRGGQQPGSLYRFGPEQVQSGALPLDSLHQVGLLETLRLGELVDCRPQRTVVIGCEPERTGLAIGLSEPVRAAVPQAARLVLEELGCKAA